MPKIRDALLAYDPKAKVIRSISWIEGSIFRVEYIDTDKKIGYFTFREREIFDE